VKGQLLAFAALSLRGWMGISNNLVAVGKEKFLAIPENQTTVSPISSP
jgi:hypothetical protein